MDKLNILESIFTYKQHGVYSWLTKIEDIISIMSSNDMECPNKEDIIKFLKSYPEQNIDLINFLSNEIVSLLNDRELVDFYFKKIYDLHSNTVINDIKFEFTSVENIFIMYILSNVINKDEIFIEYYNKVYNG